MNNIPATLDALFTRYLNLYRSEHNSLPTVKFDPRWPSQCDELPENAPDDIIRQWRPVSRKQFDIFESLESALKTEFIVDIKAYYGAFWSNGFCTSFQPKEGPELTFNLIQIWNEEDEEQLKENMLGHAFAKLKGRLPLTLFIGCTDADDIIAVDNTTGEVVLEKPGYKAHTILAENLETFLLNLSPTLYNYD